MIYSAKPYPLLYVWVVAYPDTGDTITLRLKSSAQHHSTAHAGREGCMDFKISYIHSLCCGTSLIS